MHLGPFGVLWITGAVSRVGCPVVGGCRALAVAGSSSGESPTRLSALLPLHPAGFPTSGGGIPTGRRMDGEVPPRREHVDEEGERLSHSGCRWCDDPAAPRLVGRLRDVLAATVGVTVDRGQRQAPHRQPGLVATQICSQAQPAGDVHGAGQQRSRDKVRHERLSVGIGVELYRIDQVPVRLDDD